MSANTIICDFIQTAASPLSHQNSMCNPHSTTSPKGSPNISLTNSSQMTPPPTFIDDNDNNNNVDEGFENDNISVTGSPALATSIHEDDDPKRSPSPPAATGGAFTALIQRNPPSSTIPLLPPTTGALKKGDFLSGIAAHMPQPNAFNHALAAQLFLQSPLIPQPSQWLYTQLYSNYNEMPWFRNSMNGPFRNADTATVTGKYPSMDLAKRAVKLISHQSDSGENDAVARVSSPPVTSSRQSPDTIAADDDGDDQDVEVVVTTCKKGETIGPIRCRTPKQVDVWRPY